jgi:hypothetical protein
MEYALLGFVIPIKDDNEANSVICKLTNACVDSGCDLSGAYTIAGIPTISNITEFGSELELFIKKYMKAEI